MELRDTPLPLIHAVKIDEYDEENTEILWHSKYARSPDLPTALVIALDGYTRQGVCEMLAKVIHEYCSARQHDRITSSERELLNVVEEYLQKVKARRYQ